MDEKLASNHHKCECCGRRTAKQRGGKWICRYCATEGKGISNEQRRLRNTKPVYARNKMRSQSDVLAHDTKPIAGIGDSLKTLDEKLKDIENELTSKLNNECVDAAHLNDMHL